MKSRKRYSSKDEHALFSPSNPAFLNKSDEEIRRYIDAQDARVDGTNLHEYRELAITYRQKQPKTKTTISMYVNDCIKRDMDTEVKLIYSDYLFGTADAISYDGKTLRVYDLKTGVTKAHIDQVIIYRALYCMVYDINPLTIKEYDLRIYQNDDIIYATPDGNMILQLMDRLQHINDIATEYREEKRG